jgi:hypothetical protein
MEYPIDEFITLHNSKHKHYCEAIVQKNGNIVYAEPSHTLRLQIMWGVPAQELFEGGPKRDELSRLMPFSASPIHWLAEVLGCVVLWYESIIFPPDYTKDQMASVRKLMENGCITRCPSFEVTMEYQICDDNNRSTRQLETIASRKERIEEQIRQELSLLS